MSLPDLAVRRPITVSMAVLAISVFGFLTVQRLPVELLPDVSYPTLTVQTEYPDAAPVSVEHFLTRPVEEAVGVVSGVRGMSSVSRAGLSEVVLTFDWDEDMDFAALEVREKLGLIEVPREAGVPRVLRFDPSLEPIVRLALRGDRDLGEVRQVAERWIKPRLDAVQGVAAAKVRGGLDPEIHIDADSDRLAALGLTLGDLATALRAENINRPGGRLRDWGTVFLVRTFNEFEDLEQIRRTIVRESAKGRVRVEDVAEVVRGFRDRDEITRADGEEVVEIALHREGSANTIAVSKAIRAEVEALRGEMADDLEISVLSDQAVYIDKAVSEAWSAALIGGALAILVLFFFLRDLPSTLIIALTIPISVLATFLPMSRAGVSLNVMALGGLALGIGMLVDNSIVVLESIDRRRREGLSRREAAAAGARDVASAVVAATLTTVCVFFPIVFVRGVAGQMFYDLAVTVCFSLTASLLVSLTLIPSLAAITFTGSRALKNPEGFGSAGAARPLTMRLGFLQLPPIGDGVSLPSRLATYTFFPLRFAVFVVLSVLGSAWWVFHRLFEVFAYLPTKLLDALGAIYPHAVRSALRWRFAVVASAFLLFALSLVAISGLGIDLVPDLTQGEFAFRLHLPAGTPLSEAARTVAQIERSLLADGRFERIFSVTGSLPSSASGKQTIGENLAQINFVLPEGSSAAKERAAVARVRQVLSGFPRVEGEVARAATLNIKPPIVVNVFSDELEALHRASAEVEQALGNVPGVEDISSTSEPGNPEVRIDLDRDRASALGLTAEDLALSLRRQIQGEVVGQFREEAERVDIRVRSSEAWRDQASEVEALPLRLPGGMIVPVSSVAAVTMDRGPAAIHRVGGGRVSVVSARIQGGDLSNALERVRDALRSLPLGAGVVAETAGQDRDLKVSLESLKLALALAVFLVYVVMAMQFESLRHPFVILLSLPLGAVGVIAILLWTRRPVSVLALIGVVMLAGIVVNNAIVLVDAINRRIRRGEAIDRAICAAGRERLRPILMTTATTVLGLLPMTGWVPLAPGGGAGNELRAPLAVTVIGGLLAGTLLTLIVIPCIYRIASGRSTLRSAGEGGASTGSAADDREGSESEVEAP